MASGVRVPESQPCGESLPPATSQLRRLLLLSVVEVLPKVFVLYVPAIR